MADMQIRLINRETPGAFGEWFVLHAYKKLGDGEMYEWAMGYIEPPTDQQRADFEKQASRAFARSEKRIASGQ